MTKLINPNTYYKTFNVIDKYYPKITFFFFVGGRNTGKTFNTVKDLTDRHLQYFYFRRTDTQLKISFKAGLYNKISQHYPEYSGYSCEYNKEISMIFSPDNDLIGFGGSFTTADNLTGGDYSMIKAMFWDEFIRKKNERRTLYDELETLKWTYETIARNRELEGEDPLLFIGCSNSNTITNDIFIGLNCVHDLENVIKRGGDTYIDYERRFMVVMMETPEELLEARKETAIAQFSKGSNYYDLSLKNEFADDDFDMVKRISIKGFKPVCKINNAYLWKKKGQEFYYFTFAKFKARESYNLDHDVERYALARNYPWLTGVYEERQIRFESIELKENFLDIFYPNRLR